MDRSYPDRSYRHPLTAATFAAACFSFRIIRYDNHNDLIIVQTLQYIDNVTSNTFTTQEIAKIHTTSN